MTEDTEAQRDEIPQGVMEAGSEARSSDSKSVLLTTGLK